MKRLTKVEEKQIVEEALKYGSYIGHGSSRAVFSLGNGKVIKVAYDRKGQYQNHVEIDMYSQYGNKYLTEVYAYGKYIVVAEEVDSDFDMEDVIYDYDTKEYRIARLEREGADPEVIQDEMNSLIQGLTDEQVEQAIDVKDELDYMLGCTSDNYQLGVRKNGEVVAFDYGYIPDDHDMSVSYLLSDFLYDTCDGDYYELLIFTSKRLLRNKIGI